MSSNKPNAESSSSHIQWFALLIFICITLTLLHLFITTVFMSDNLLCNFVTYFFVQWKILYNKLFFYLNHVKLWQNSLSKWYLREMKLRWKIFQLFTPYAIHQVNIVPVVQFSFYHSFILFLVFSPTFFQCAQYYGNSRQITRKKILFKMRENETMRTSLCFAQYKCWRNDCWK